MNAITKYPGSKWRIASWIINFFPEQFDRLREDNPMEWEFWMYRCCKDKETGEVYGWGKVLDYIGVEWEDIPATQISMFEHAWEG